LVSPVFGGLAGPSRSAPIAQLAEAADLKSAQCRFEPDWGYSTTGSSRVRSGSPCEIHQTMSTAVIPQQLLEQGLARVLRALDSRRKAVVSDEDRMKMLNLCDDNGIEAA
jgi:hypothetical protein